MNSTTDILHKKLIQFSFFTYAALAFIALRLGYLQIYLQDTFAHQSKKNFSRVEQLASPRGNILDINRVPLVTNRPVVSVYWQGVEQKTNTEEIEKILTMLETIAHQEITSDPLIKKNIHQANKRHAQVCLASDITFEQMRKIEEQFADNPNIVIKTDFQRYYPWGSYASHLLGYLGKMELCHIGKMGLEKIYEQTLQGQPGMLLKKMNAVGKRISETELAKTVAGADIHSTIDITLQQLAERVFPSSRTGSCIVMDPITGAVHALVSRPSFDPRIFLSPIYQNQWNALQRDKPFINRALTACYPPGSIFKLVTISAALEHHLIEPDHTVECKGYTHFGNRKYWCNKRYGHGEVTIRQSMAQSCNILFFELGKEMDIDLLADYAARFGLGQKTGIHFPEQIGIVPSHAWKEENRGERWWPGETLSVTIGQSFLSVTPMQVACMISSIFTGYRVTPRILLNDPIETIPLDIKPDTLDFLQKTMKAVVTKGTGKRVSTIKDLEVYAKTSTAQTSEMNKRSLGTAYKEHGWFVAHFKYKYNKPLVLVILLEHVGSSRVATTAAKNFLLSYKELMDEKKNKDEELIIL